MVHINSPGHPRHGGEERVQPGDRGERRGHRQHGDLQAAEGRKLDLELAHEFSNHENRPAVHVPPGAFEIRTHRCLFDPVGGGGLMAQILEVPFSVVSKPVFATKAHFAA